MDQITQAITVRGSAVELYQMWADIEAFPKFVEDLTAVTRTGPGTSRWTAKGPLGKEVSWDAQTTLDDVGRRIAWTTTAGDVKTSGQVVFAPLGDTETNITVTLNWTPPGGALGEAAAKLLHHPDHMVETALRAFKTHAESVAAIPGESETGHTLKGSKRVPGGFAPVVEIGTEPGE